MSVYFNNVQMFMYWIIFRCSCTLIALRFSYLIKPYNIALISVYFNNIPVFMCFNKVQVLIYFKKFWCSCTLITFRYPCTLTFRCLCTLLVTKYLKVHSWSLSPLLLVMLVKCHWRVLEFKELATLQIRQRILMLQLLVCVIFLSDNTKILHVLLSTCILKKIFMLYCL